MTIHFRNVDQRCKEAARDLAPSLPTSGTFKAWEAFLNVCENWDVLAHEEVEHWDWSIYTHYGFKILEVMPQDEINEAESRWREWSGGELNESDGPYELASAVAYFLLVARVESELHALLAEMKELAEQEIENRSE